MPPRTPSFAASKKSPRTSTAARNPATPSTSGALNPGSTLQPPIRTLPVLRIGKVYHLGRPAQFMVDEVTDALTRTLPCIIVVSRTDLKSVQDGTWNNTDVTRLNRLLDTRYQRAGEVHQQILFETR